MLRKLAVLFTFALPMMAAKPGHSVLTWSALKPIPDAAGYGGMYAGVSDGALIAAGGANFPDHPMAAGGKKAWSDRIYVLPDPTGVWREAGRLAEAAAYGASATWRDAVVCVGGGGARGYMTGAWLLRWNGQRVTREPLPSLPRPVAYAAGVVEGDTFYLLGGQEASDSTAALATVYALNLAAAPGQRAWRLLPWPEGAPARMIPIAGVAHHEIFLVSGLELGAAHSVPPGLYLRDAYTFRPGRGWKRIADLPVSVAAAPGPAFTDAESRLVVLSGVSALWGTAGGPGPATGGFAKTLYSYEVGSNRWHAFTPAASGGEPVPARVTAPLVPWRGGYAVVAGEIAPGIRTPSVLFLSAAPAANARP